MSDETNLQLQAGRQCAMACIDALKALNLWDKRAHGPFNTTTDYHDVEHCPLCKTESVLEAALVMAMTSDLLEPKPW